MNQIWERFTKLKVREGYGQTETVLMLGTYGNMKVKLGSIGKPLTQAVVTCIDENLQPCPPGKEGDVAIRVKPVAPPGIFKGYVQSIKEGHVIYDQEINGKVFKGDWYLTGDRAVLDEDGYFWFVGRGDDVIKTSGYRVGPFELENALIEHPAVAECGVIGIPDPQKGQVIKAFVTLAKGYQPSEKLVQELQEHVKKVTAPYKVPKVIEFVSELPKTISGKIRRVELRERERANSKL